jgi:TNF receptor-associated protein 1
VQGRLLKFLAREAADDAKKYADFYKDFSRFLKEGVATDFENKAAIAKLLRFESSMTGEGETVSLEEYVGRMKEGQKAIYYQIAPTRKAIEEGPYLDAFKKQGFEVIYLYETIDDYVVNSLGQFEGKDLQAVNSSEVDLGDSADQEGALPQEEAEKLTTWLKERLTNRVKEVRTGKRLVNSPAMAVLPDGEMSPQLRQMLRAMKKDDDVSDAQVILEINPAHTIVRQLASVKDSNPELAGLLGEQLLDNALLAAGLLDDPQTMIGRMHRIMEQALVASSTPTA